MSDDEDEPSVIELITREQEIAWWEEFWRSWDEALGNNYVALKGDMMNDMEYTEDPKTGSAPIVEPHRKTLITERDEWKSTTGVHLQLCAIHEMKPGSRETKQAITVLGGIAVCREHFSHMVADLQEGKPTTAIIIEALAGEY